ncbi:MAG: Gfo/Idh/MocA family oxidoreductase [Saprospiraceae bacterium]|nr:Gfo/Idh/MocA family oxidoreductase [Saprospiraceae bacterium]
MLKIGVFGVGHLGRIHVKCIQLLPEIYDLVGFYDPDDKVAQKVIDTHGIQRFETVEELLDQVDVVDIVTPTITHFDLAKQAIEKQKHFFIEKPITHTVKEAQTLMQLIADQPIKAQVGHVERFNPALLAIQDIPIDPKFIEAHRLASFNPRGTDVSVVLDLMIHDLDILLTLIPQPIKAVHANGVAILSQTPDIANVRLEFENGAVANLTASRISMKSMRKFRIFQPDAYLSLDFLNKQTEVIRLHNHAPTDGQHWMELDTGQQKRYIEVAMPEVQANNAIKMELELFAKAILDDFRPTVSLVDGVKALELAYQISEQIEQNLALMNN